MELVHMCYGTLVIYEENTSAGKLIELETIRGSEISERQVLYDFSAAVRFIDTDSLLSFYYITLYV